jgi:DNA-binding IclR family transcriptional regulator
MPRKRTKTHRIDSNGELVPSTPILTEPRFSQSLERGLTILECFNPKRPVLGITDLANKLGMSNSTTHRYVLTLTALGYLVRAEQRKYRLGLRVTELGMTALGETSLREHAHPYLEELSRRSACTLAIGALDGPEVVYVDWVRATKRGAHPTDIDLGLTKGSRAPVHCSAMGKLLAAYLPALEQRNLLEGLMLERRGPNAIRGKGTLRKELTQIVKGGVAVGDEELAPGLYEIAASVRAESRQVVAAVGMAAHNSAISLGGLVDHFAPHLVSTADLISARLGYRRDDEQAGVR